MNDAVVAAEGLVKRYGHVTAVDDVTLSVAKGEFLPLLERRRMRGKDHGF